MENINISHTIMELLSWELLFQITEKGTEAAAATSAFVFRMAPSNVMQFDRPFFLFIYDALNKVSKSINSILVLFKTSLKWLTIGMPLLENGEKDLRDEWD